RFGEGIGRRLLRHRQCIGGGINGQDIGVEGGDQPPMLRDVFATLDRVREGFMRRQMLDQVEDWEEEQRLLRRFVKKTVATIERFVLRVKETVLLEGLTPESREGVVVGLLPSLIPIIEHLARILPSLF
ncbi:MAG: hypothetical protein AAGF44_06470, partial [Pseudomonadota bacterium]